MALRGAAARRYAQAVYDIARENNTLDQWLADLKAVTAVFGSSNAASVLEDPALAEVEQRRAMDEQLAKLKIQPMVANLLYMLVQRQRLALLPRILESYQQFYNRAKGIVIADVTSAVPLDEAQQKRVIAELSKITGKTIELRVHQDPAILGGLITRIGDELIDASIATRLATLAERLN